MQASDLFSAAGAYRLSQAIYAAASLGVADHLRDGDMSAAELASAVHADVDLLRRLMRALASEGIFTETEDGRFGLAPAGRLLTAGGGGRDMVLGWTLLPAAYSAFGSLAESVRSGRNSFELAHGMRFHDYLGHNPAAAHAYDAANAETGEAFDAAVATYDFAGHEVVVDVGGGTGGFLAAILRAYPRVQGVLFDIPAVISTIVPGSFAADVDERLTRVSGDFFADPIPSGDVYLLSTVLRLFDDDRANAILRNIRASMKDDSRVLVLDFVHPAGRLRSPFGLADLQAMVVYGGRDRSAAEFAALFAATDLRLVRVIQSDGVHSWIEAVSA